MKKVRFGVVGMGKQGNFYAKLLLEGQIENGVLTAVCNRSEGKLKAFTDANKDKNVATFTDYKKMFTADVCDAVLVVTPHYSHAQIVVEGLKNGLHVLCDKPLGVCVSEVREMKQVARERQVKLSVMFNQRTNCVYRKMREIVQGGNLGVLQRVTWIITDWYRPQAYYNSSSWRATWAGEGGGVLINQCPHQIDLLQWIVGEMPVSIRGFCRYGQWHEIEVEDDVTAYFTYKNGATGVFITSTGETPGTNRFEISGTKGKLLCEGEKLFWYKNKTDSQQFSKTTQDLFPEPPFEKIQVQTDGENKQHVGIINNFVNAVLGKEKLFVVGEDAINGVELMNAIQLSGWKNGEEVILPIDENEYLTRLSACKKSSK